MRQTSLLIIGGGLGLALLTCGCTLTRVPADPGAPERIVNQARPVPESDWPARLTNGLPSVTYHFGSTPLPSVPGDPPALADEPEMYSIDTVCAPVARGAITHTHLVFGRRHNPPPSLPLPFTFHAWNAGTPVPEGLADAQPTDSIVPLEFKRFTDQECFRAGFALYGPLGSRTRGLVLHVSSIGPRQYEQTVIDAMRRHGWAVLTVSDWMCRYGPQPGHSEAPATRPADPASAPTDEDLRRAGELLAAPLQSFLADMAYACEGALALLAQEHPPFPMPPEVRQLAVNRPVVIVGMSLGALVTPAIAARLPRAPAAVVLVGGGANLLGILASTPIEPFSNALAPFSASALGETAAARIESEYLSHASLDAFHTAPLLARTPVLMLHAADDGIVPARYGDLLWERLGRPERWVGNYGHELLFWYLPWHADEIADWVDAAVPESPEAR